MSVDAYRRARAIIESPRGTEYRLISNVTGEMIQARDAGLAGTALMPALHRNRAVWGTFSSMCAAPGNQLSDELRAGIISLALWVDRHTTLVVRGQDTIDELISVNRTLMDGLQQENFSPEA
ncbi:flagellar biosynthesis regulator FlaF [Sphingomonas quercus]|uniref:Flagellar biosynthesis regulator FlaF n=1 Tax=Sphingomonas quercus TaxID=2842451 RepID=A0ABS6BK22_9SPHN|nr:flagellar biosynthesis regulator FlaF [Sphingomonas quercus]MBU3078645.1 flagellar biosynthesis regulator FlaF [Sphingomonas quercus]